MGGRGSSMRGSQGMGGEMCIRDSPTSGQADLFQTLSVLAHRGRFCIFRFTHHMQTCATHAYGGNKSLVDCNKKEHTNFVVTKK